MRRLFFFVDFLKILLNFLPRVTGDSYAIKMSFLVTKITSLLFSNSRGYLSRVYLFSGPIGAVDGRSLKIALGPSALQTESSGVRDGSASVVSISIRSFCARCLP